MKKPFLMILSFFLINTIFATYQEESLLAFNGEHIYSNNLPHLTKAFPNTEIPNFAELKSTNCKGYTATWAVFSKKLYLIGVEGSVKIDEKLKRGTHKRLRNNEVIKGREFPIFAKDWSGYFCTKYFGYIFKEGIFQSKTPISSEVEKWSYRSLYDKLRVNTDQECPIRATIRATSDQPWVRVYDLELKIPYNDRVITSDLSLIPLSEEVYKQNPLIVTNKPKGSIKLKFGYEFIHGYFFTKEADGGYPIKNFEFPKSVKNFRSMLEKPNFLPTKKLRDELIKSTQHIYTEFTLKGKTHPLKTTVNIGGEIKEYLADKNGICKIKLKTKDIIDKEIIVLHYADSAVCTKSRLEK